MLVSAVMSSSTNPCDRNCWYTDRVS